MPKGMIYDYAAETREMKFRRSVDSGKRLYGNIKEGDKHGEGREQNDRETGPGNGEKTAGCTQKTVH